MFARTRIGSITVSLLLMGALVKGASITPGSYCTASGQGIVVGSDGVTLYGESAYLPGCFFGYNYTLDPQGSGLSLLGPASNCQVGAMTYLPISQALVVVFPSAFIATYTTTLCNSLGNATTPPSQTLCGALATVTFANTFFVLHGSNGSCYGSRTSASSLQLASTCADVYSSPIWGNWSFATGTFILTVTVGTTGQNAYFHFSAIACNSPAASAAAPVVVGQSYCSTGYNAADPIFGSLAVVFVDQQRYALTTGNCFQIGQYASIATNSIDLITANASSTSCGEPSMNFVFFLSGFGYNPTTDQLTVAVLFGTSDTNQYTTYTLGNCAGLPSTQVPSGTYCSGWQSRMTITGQLLFFRSETGDLSVMSYTWTPFPVNTTTFNVVGSTTAYYANPGTPTYTTPLLTMNLNYDGSILTTVGNGFFTFSTAQCSQAPMLISPATFWMSTPTFKGPMIFYADGTFLWILNGTSTSSNSGSCLSTASTAARGTAVLRGTKIAVLSFRGISSLCMVTPSMSNASLIGGALAFSLSPTVLVTSLSSSVPPTPAVALLQDGLYCGAPLENLTVFRNYYLWNHADGGMTFGTLQSTPSWPPAIVSGIVKNFFSGSGLWVPQFTTLNADGSLVIGALTLNFASQAGFNTFTQGPFSTTVIRPSTNGACSAVASAWAPLTPGAYCSPNVFNGTMRIAFAGGGFVMTLNNTITGTLTCLMAGTAWLSSATNAVAMTVTSSQCQLAFGITSATWSAAQGLTINATLYSGENDPSNLNPFQFQLVTLTPCRSTLAKAVPSGPYCADPNMLLPIAAPIFVIMDNYVAVYEPAFGLALSSYTYNSVTTNLTMTMTFFPTYTVSSLYNFSLTSDGSSLRFNRAWYLGSSDIVSLVLRTDLCGSLPSSSIVNVFAVSDQRFGSIPAMLQIGSSAFNLLYNSPTGLCELQGQVSFAGQQGSLLYSQAPNYFSCSLTIISNLVVNTSTGAASLDLYTVGVRYHLTFNISACYSPLSITAPLRLCGDQGAFTFQTCGLFYAMTSARAAVTLTGTSVTLPLSLLDAGTLLINVNGTLTTQPVSITPRNTYAPQALLQSVDATTTVLSYFNTVPRLFVLASATCVDTAQAAINAVTAAQFTQFVPVGVYCGSRPSTSPQSVYGVLTVTSLPGNQMTFTYSISGAVSQWGTQFVVRAMDSNGLLSLSDFGASFSRITAMAYTSGMLQLNVTLPGSSLEVWIVNTTTCNLRYAAAAITEAQRHGTYTFGQGTYSSTSFGRQFTMIVIEGDASASVQNTVTGQAVTTDFLYIGNYSGVVTNPPNSAMIRAGYLSSNAAALSVGSTTEAGQDIVFTSTFTMSPFAVTPPPTPQPVTTSGVVTSTTPVPVTNPAVAPPTVSTNSPASPSTAAPGTTPQAAPTSTSTATAPGSSTVTPTTSGTTSPPASTNAPGGSGAAPPSDSGLSTGATVGIAVAGVVAVMGLVAGGGWVYFAKLKANAPSRSDEVPMTTLQYPTPQHTDAAYTGL